MKKKIIIIGAGVSGLSLAAHLLYKGFEVEIFEKNSKIGGKTNRLSSGKFNFDLTASILMLPEDYINVFRDCGKNYKKYFSLMPLSPSYRCFYHDNSFYDFYTNLPSLNKTLKDITHNNTDDIHGYYEFISDNYRKYLYMNKNLLNRNFLKYYNLLSPYVLKGSSNLNAAKDCASECMDYIKNEKLSQFLMFQTMYIGMSPYDSPSVYNSIPASTQVEGLYYIKGGMYSYIKALKRLVYDLGGTIKTCHEVNDILFRKNIAYGVLCGEKVYKCDKVVCCCDYTNTVKNLIKDKDLKSNFKNKKNLSYSCSVFMLYLAVDKKYPILKVNNIYINKNFKKNINAPFKGILSSNPSLYIYCPSSIDDNLCSEKYETINVMVRVPNLISSKVTWDNKTCLKIKKQLLDILSSINTLGDIKDHILFDSFLTPLDLRDKFNLYEGNAFGLSHSLNRSIIFRPQCCNPKIKNLYFAGSSIHPGNGISMCLKSARICASKIINSEKK